MGLFKRKQKETHEQIAVRIQHTYSVICNNCGHVDREHNADHISVDSMKIIRGVCRCGHCDKFIQMSPLMLSEIIEDIYETEFQR